MCWHVLAETVAKLVKASNLGYRGLLYLTLQGDEKWCRFFSLSWELVYDSLKSNGNRVFSLAFLHWILDILKRWMTWDVQGDESISHPFSNMSSWLHCEEESLSMWSTSPFSWHSASQERLEESSRDSSCSVCVRARKPTWTFLIYGQDLSGYLPTFYSNIFGTSAQAYLCI